MIQRASDPNASRMNWRPSAPGGKEGGPEPRRIRSGHAWPFLSKDIQRPAAQGAPQAPRTDSGS